jgi:ribosomal protein L29
MSKTTRVKELRQKSENELANMVKDGRVALRSFRFVISGSKTKNVREGRNARHALARALTILKEKNAK